MADAFLGGRSFAAARPGLDNVTVSVPNIPLWVPEAARRQIEQLVIKTLRLAMESIAGSVSSQFADNHNDTGNTAQSFTANPASTFGGLELLGQTFHAGAEIYGRVFSSLPQAMVLNDGRRPGAPISRDGIDAIGLWAQRKLGLNAEQAQSAKWAIAKSIIAQGIQGSGYFDAGVEQAKPTVEHLFAALTVAVGQALITPGNQQGGA